MNTRLLIGILILSLSSLVHGEIYKWVDEHGETHYGDKPESGQPATQVNVAEKKSKNILPVQESRDERRRKLADVMQEDRLKKNEEKEKARAQKEELNKQCVYARDRLRNLEASGHLYNLDKDGNRVILSDEERNASINDYRAQIKAHCGD